MLGSVISRCSVDPGVSVSRRLSDYVSANWSDVREVNRASLVKQEETWKEFWLYASNTKYWCPRLSAIQSVYQIPPSKFSSEDKWNFGQGNALHYLFQSDMFQSLGEKFLGSWVRYVKTKDGSCGYRCEYYPSATYNCGPSDSSIVRGWGPKPDGDGWAYTESKVRLNKHRIVVKLDGIIDWGDGDLEVQEIKSEKSSARDDLDSMMGGAPREHHVDQCTIGMHATGIKKCRLIYVFKGEPYLKNAFLEYEIVYDAARAELLLAQAESCVGAVKKCDELCGCDPENGYSFESAVDSYQWLNDNFERRDTCPMKSKGDARYCIGRDFCFQKIKKVS